MKELTIEQKAQRYDEAIEIAKRINNEQQAQPFNIMTRVFPELKESEDEKIRKTLIHIVKCACDKYGIKYQGKEIGEEKLLAWIEKQGKQETDEWKEGDIIRHGDILALVIKGRRAMKSNGELFTVQYPNEWVKAAPNEIERFLNELEKQGEHKPAEKTTWYDNMDDLIADTMIDDIKNADIPEHCKHNRITWTNKHRGKPAEWSEEDEKMFNEIAVHLNATCCGFPEDEKWANKFLDWLKSFKNRVQPQPQQQWSEEDEYCRHQLIVFCENCVVQDDGAKRCAHWLKSLRPQSTWKPSDEQMNALNYVVNLMASSERPTENDLYYNILKSLRQQLKKHYL